LSCLAERINLQPFYPELIYKGINESHFMICRNSTYTGPVEVPLSVENVIWKWSRRNMVGIYENIIFKP